jgi:hypothetical protein
MRIGKASHVFEFDNLIEALGSFDLLSYNAASLIHVSLPLSSLVIAHCVDRPFLGADYLGGDLDNSDIQLSSQAARRNYYYKIENNLIVKCIVTHDVDLDDIDDAARRQANRVFQAVCHSTAGASIRVIDTITFDYLSVSFLAANSFELQ